MCKGSNELSRLGHQNTEIPFQMLERGTKGLYMLYYLHSLIKCLAAIIIVVVSSS